MRNEGKGKLFFTEARRTRSAYNKNVVEYIKSVVDYIIFVVKNGVFFYI